jgi:hypothetical protein
MADRVQRLLYNNLVAASASTLTSSSEQSTAAPLAWLRNAVRSKPWRSKLGWNIVAGKNDKIDFNRGGVKVATITAGSYTTGAALAAAVVTAMTAADGGATWTCSYAANTFTVGANLAFVLLFGSGTNLATSAAKELGFAVSDTGSATSQVAGNVSNHTREWVDIDLGTSQQIGGAAIASHNLSASGVATLILSAAPLVGLDVAGDVRVVLAGTTGTRVGYVTPASYRYARILFDDVANAAGYVEVGIAFVGGYWQPGRSIAQGYTEAPADYSEIALSDSGVPYRNARARVERFTFDLKRVSQADRDAHKVMMAAVGVGGCLFLALDAVNSPYSYADTFYGWITAEPERTQNIGDGTTANRFTMRYGFQEAGS